MMFLLVPCQEVCMYNGNAPSECKSDAYYIVCRDMLPTLKRCPKNEMYDAPNGQCITSKGMYSSPIFPHSFSPI